MKISKPSLPQIIKQHKFVGVLLSLWLLLMVLTGILLNHTNDFKLDQIPIQSKFLLSFYGVSPPSSGHTYKIDSHRSLHQFGETLFFNEKKMNGVPLIKETMLICKNENMVIIYWPDYFALFTLDGELIESKNIETNLNAKQIGTDVNGQFYLKAKGTLYEIDSDALNYTASHMIESEINWAETEPLSEDRIDLFSQHISYDGLTYERLIIDIHNGNILGGFSKYIVDLLSILFMLLIFSGVYIWYKKISIKKKKL